MIVPAGRDTGKTAARFLSHGRKENLMRYSILDLAPVPEGSTAREAIDSSVALAR